MGINKEKSSSLSSKTSYILTWSLSGWIKYATFGLKTSASCRNTSKFTPRSICRKLSIFSGPLRMLGRERHTRGPFTSSVSATCTWPLRLHHYIAPSFIASVAFDKFLIKYCKEIICLIWRHLCRVFSDVSKKNAKNRCYFRWKRTTLKNEGN